MCKVASAITGGKSPSHELRAICVEVWTCARAEVFGIAAEIASVIGTQRAPFVLAGKSAGKKQKYSSATTRQLGLVNGAASGEICQMPLNFPCAVLRAECGKLETAFLESFGSRVASEPTIRTLLDWASS
jgi:hypothetical protein